MRTRRVALLSSLLLLLSAASVLAAPPPPCFWGGARPEIAFWTQTPADDEGARPPDFTLIRSEFGLEGRFGAFRLAGAVDLGPILYLDAKGAPAGHLVLGLVWQVGAVLPGGRVEGLVGARGSWDWGFQTPPNVLVYQGSIGGSFGFQVSGEPGRPGFRFAFEPGVVVWVRVPTFAWVFALTF